MSEDLESQLRAWAQAVDDPIPVERVHSGDRVLPRRRPERVLAVAAVLLFLVGVLALLPGGDDSADVTAVADDTALDVPPTSPATSAPPATVEAEKPPEPTSTTTPSTTSTTSPSTTSTTTRVGTVSGVEEPPDGEGCEGLRSETVWANSGDPDEITAPAGASAGYVETVTNDGPSTCSMVFARCGGSGGLFTADGEPAPSESRACPAIGHSPEELQPGASRQESLTVELHTAPGSYELRAHQYDGRVATLPIRLDDRIGACDPGALMLDQRPFEAYTERGGTVFDQLLFETAEQSCTVRITETRMSLRASSESGASEHVFVDERRRWYATGDERIVGEAHFGQIDLPPAQYEGAITVHLDSGDTFTKPARLLVG